MKSAAPFNARLDWLRQLGKPESIRYLAFVLMFAGLGSAALYARAATAAHSITGVGGGCLTAGSPVQLKHCDGSAQQQWQVSQDGAIGQGGKCLDIERTIGLATRMAACDGSKYQRWHQDDQSAILNLSNASCLQPAIGGEAGGARSVVTAACSGSANERWQTGN